MDRRRRPHHGGRNSRNGPPTFRKRKEDAHRRNVLERYDSNRGPAQALPRLRVPDDLSVIGFDDIHIAEVTIPPLTTIQMSRFELARAAVTALRAHVEDFGDSTPKRDYNIQTELILRRIPPALLANPSTGGAKPSRKNIRHCAEDCTREGARDVPTTDTHSRAHGHIHPHMLCLAQNPHVYNLSGDVAGTHDPSIIKEGNTWYVFATGKAPDGGQFAVRCSQDLKHWKLCGHVFDAVPTGSISAALAPATSGRPTSPMLTTNTASTTPTPSSEKTPPASPSPPTRRSTRQAPTSDGSTKASSSNRKLSDNYNAIDPKPRPRWKRRRMARLRQLLGMASKCGASTTSACSSKRGHTLYSLARRARTRDHRTTPTQSPRELAGHRSPLHRPSRRLLLSLHLLGSLLPRP